MQCWQSHVLHSLLRSNNESLYISHGYSMSFTIFGSGGHKFDSYVILFLFCHPATPTIHPVAQSETCVTFADLC